MSYWKAVLIALDQLLNAFCGGWPDETFSSRCWRWKVAGVRVWPWFVVECLFFWERGHCREAFESERQGRQLPPEARATWPPRKAASRAARAQRKPRFSQARASAIQEVWPSDISGRQGRQLPPEARPCA